MSAAKDKRSTPLLDSFKSKKIGANPIATFCRRLMEMLMLDGVTFLLLGLAIVGVQIWCAIDTDTVRPAGMEQSLYVLLHLVAAALAFHLITEALGSLTSAELVRELRDGVVPLITDIVDAKK